jgi:autophagy-related protein 2
MRKRLAKIRQLVANGQIQDPTIEDTSTLLFNSVHIGLEQDEDALEDPVVLIAAIDEELKDDFDATSQSSWQSLRTPNPNKSRNRSTRVHGKRLTRSKTPSIEFYFMGLQTEFEQYGPKDPLVSRTLVTVKNLEILDHIKTSTWKKFLTELRSDSHGNVRETGSNMVRIELQGVRPVLGHSSKEFRLKVGNATGRIFYDF